MSEDIKQEIPQKRLFAEAKGKYTLVDGQKVYAFEFHNQASLMENYDAISYMREKLWKAIEDQKKKEEADMMTEEQLQNAVKEGEIIPN